MSEEKPKEKFTLAEVPKDMEIMITDGEKVYTTQETLVLLLNKLDRLEKKVVGE